MQSGAGHAEGGGKLNYTVPAGDYVCWSRFTVNYYVCWLFLRNFQGILIQNCG